MTSISQKKTIYIIRHCDKPVDYKEEGNIHEKDCLCSKQGYIRANMLVDFWKDKIQVNDKVAFYASAYSPENDKCSCEQREVLVLLPTATYYKQPVIHNYCFYQIQESANEILNMDV